MMQNQMMMMQQMMMQNQMNPMMGQMGPGPNGVPPMSAEDMRRAQGLNVPSKRSSRRGSRSQRSGRSDASGTSARGANKSLVKDLFSKARNGKHREVEELYARGVPPDTV